MLRYFAMDNIRVTDETISLLKGRFNNSQSHLQTDFENLAGNLRDLRARTETDINYFVARLSAKEAHRAQLQADELKWMNYAVFMLGPVSTLAAILALQERDRNVLMFLACACAAGLIVLLLRFWRSVPRALSKWEGKIRARWVRNVHLRAEKDDVNRIGEELLFDYLGD